MLAGRKLYAHPSRLDRGYVLEKLMVFLQEHHASPSKIVLDLQQAIEQIPVASIESEAIPIKAFQQKSIRSRRSEPKELGSLLVAVLAKLGIDRLES